MGRFLLVGRIARSCLRFRIERRCAVPAPTHITTDIMAMPLLWVLPLAALAALVVLVGAAVVPLARELL